MLIQFLVNRSASAVASVLLTTMEEMKVEQEKREKLVIGRHLEKNKEEQKAKEEQKTQEEKNKEEQKAKEQPAKEEAKEKSSKEENVEKEKGGK